MKVSDLAFQNAIERINSIASFTVCFIEDPVEEAKFFKNSNCYLTRDLESGEYLLTTPKATVKKNVVKAADEIEQMESANRATVTAGPMCSLM